MVRRQRQQQQPRQRGLILYFGTEMPDPSWAASAKDTDVVVQPYHPMVAYGGFAETFPNARRWVYANPTTVDPWILERAAVRPPITDHDEVWGLPRLDLDATAGIDWAVDHLRQVAEMARREGHGVFVDDLDRLVERPDLALELLARTPTAGTPGPRWFLNRAFDLWDRVENLDAVLLECLTPRVAASMDIDGVRWVRQVVLPALERAARRGVSCHSLDYPDQFGGGPTPYAGQITARVPDESVRWELARLVSSTVAATDRGLSDWRPRSRPPQHQTSSEQKAPS